MSLFIKELSGDSGINGSNDVVAAYKVAKILLHQKSEFSN